MKPKRNEQVVAALLAVSVALVLLASVDFLAQLEARFPEWREWMR